jgi:hypothetical protein
VTIPEIRDRLYELAAIHGIEELTTLADETRRKHHRRRAPVAAREVTPELAADIRAYAKRHPTMTLHNVGIQFGVNQGRVSEVLFGFRDGSR